MKLFPEPHHNLRVRPVLFACGRFLGVSLAAALLVSIGCSSPEPEEQELTGVLHQEDPDFEWYSKYVRLENRGIKMAKNFKGDRMVIFNGVIHNDGEKTLDVIEVELSLFNFDQRVHDEIRVPISPNSRYTPPIPPLQSRGFTLYMEEFPSHWNASSAEMSIHGFRFQESEW